MRNHILAFLNAYATAIITIPLVQTYLNSVMGEAIAETQITYLPIIYLVTVFKIAHDVKQKFMKHMLQNTSKREPVISIPDKLEQYRYEYEYYQQSLTEVDAEGHKR